ncbi:hypothetical protein BGZ76_006652 [Entomortierella beljakovae]|nr:hypothetical protein BGZ76_006652 [Entomortierella beljakovae]
MQSQFQKHYMQQQRHRQQQQLSTFNPNRLSLPNTASNSAQQHQQFQEYLSHSKSSNNNNSHLLPQLQIQQLQQQQQQMLQQQQHQNQMSNINEKSAAGVGRAPRLSLDTSDERLQNLKFVQHGNKRYLKLLSPGLVESPVSFLSQKQLTDDKKLWENGPNEAFQKQLEMERRDAYKARSKQQLRGFFMGLWLGLLLGFLMLQQTSTKMYTWGHESMASFTPIAILLVLISSVAIVRSGTRCTISAVATCAAVLTCFATLIVSHSRYIPEFQIYNKNSPSAITY